MTKKLLSPDRRRPGYKFKCIFNIGKYFPHVDHARQLSHEGTSL